MVPPALPFDRKAEFRQRFYQPIPILPGELRDGRHRVTSDVSADSLAKSLRNHLRENLAQ